MGQIIYRTGSLFEAPLGAVLVHSCNGRGVWGSGVARQMKTRFPAAYEKYRLRCASVPWEQLRGVAQVSHCPPFWIASLPVSARFGAQRDASSRIVEATRAALRGLLWPAAWGGEPVPREFHLPRINAETFGVPWETTAGVLEELARKYDAAWTIWTP